MGATRKQLRERIVAMIPEIIGSEDFPETLLNKLINEAQHNVQRSLSAFSLKNFETSITISSPTPDTYMGENVSSFGLNALTQRLSVPHGLRYITVGYTTIGGDNIYGVAREVDNNKFGEMILNDYAVDYKKPIFTIQGSTVFVAPMRAGSIPFTPVYIKYADELSTDSSATLIPTEYEIFIIKDVEIAVRSALKQIQDKQVAMEELMVKIKEAEQAYLQNLKPEFKPSLSPVGEGVRLQ